MADSNWKSERETALMTLLKNSDKNLVAAGY